MSATDVLRLIEIVVWPIVALVALVVIRPSISELLGGVKVKLSIAGQVIETTLPELKRIFEDFASEQPLTEKHIDFMRELQTNGTKDHPDGINDDERDFLRPLRNAGLIQTYPPGKPLRKATAINLSALGRLYLQARGA